ncbi:MAG: ABC transporter ATP-binding protein [Acidimicrobiia bacterium]|nr:ABC transporter ATP-binding protein [Acidimicrobiia bacterium]MCZ7532746.1 ABC transporter ATP-binding protein [Acidimicrobiia bacterium]
MNDSNGLPLQFEGVGLTYPDGTEALRGVSLSIAPGEFVSVVGSSGCGKSTLLKLASGLIQPTDGRVVVDRARLGYVFQDATLAPWRTVQKNVELLPELHHIDKAERRRIACEAIDMVGLSGFEQHYPKSLSGGMKMRVSLARSLTLDPNVFLFDEPFSALDEITRERLNAELAALFKSQGFAGLFITHNIFEAAYLSTRVLVMSKRPGRIVAEVEVPFSYPRDEGLRFQPEFADVGDRISKALRETHE